MQTFLWGVTVISSFVGGLCLMLAFVAANGAPQEAALAAMGVAFAVIPYCIARASAVLGRVECLQCAELIRGQAKQCPYCGIKRAVL